MEFIRFSLYLLALGIGLSSSISNSSFWTKSGRSVARRVPKNTFLKKKSQYSKLHTRDNVQAYPDTRDNVQADVQDSTGGTVCQSAEFHDPNWTPLPNMVAGMRGYNMLEGNPFDQSRDPGFVGQIFVPATMKDGRMELEGGITANDLTACKQSMQSDAFTSIESLRRFAENMTKNGWDLQLGLEYEVSAGAEVAGVDLGMSTTIPRAFTRAWGSSHEMNEMSHFFTSEQGMLSVSIGYCEEYEMILDRGMPPPFTDMFKAALVKLYDVREEDEGKKAAAFKSFIEDFGTHYLKEVSMGAEFRAETKFSKLARETLTAEKLNDCNYKNGAKIFGIQVEKDNNNCKEEDMEKLTELGKDNVQMSVTTKGSRPTDIDNWAEQEFNPVPLKFKLAPIVNLFTDKYFRANDVSTLGPRDPDTRRRRKIRIKGRDILSWFLPIYTTEDRFCNTMDIDCSQKLGCGISDTCPVDTVCDRSKSISSDHSCTDWTEWECSTRCGRGYSERRMRQCDGCLGSAFDQVNRICKAQIGCYGFTLKITKSTVNNPVVPVPQVTSAIAKQFSVCMLLKVTSKTGNRMALFNLRNEGHENVLKMFVLTGSYGGLEMDLGGSLFVFESFKDNYRWHHICVTWNHQFSIFGEATLYINGLFAESKSISLMRTIPQNEGAGVGSQEAGRLVVGGHIAGDGEGSIVSSDTFVGLLSGLYMYNRILTATDVQEAYQGYAPAGDELFVWDNLLNPGVTISTDVEISRELINPVDVIRAYEDKTVFESTPLPWREAENICEDRGGHLASVETEEENKRLVKELGRRNLKHFWIGLSSEEPSSSSDGRDWKWNNRDSSTYTNWNGDNAPTGLSGKSCVAVGSDGIWKAESCDKRYGFVCKVGEVLIALKNGKVSGGSGAANAYDGHLMHETTVYATHTSSAWWQAELEKKATITKVHVYPSQDAGWAALLFYIRTSMDGNRWHLCSQNNRFGIKQLSGDKSIMFKCDTPQLGKFIKITADSPTLQFNEIKVYGTLPDDIVRFPRPVHGSEGGRPYTQGYVEVRYDGRWGTVCDNVFADNHNGAQVVCRMMGYTDGVYADAYKQKDLAAKRKRTVWLDNVACNGGEESIFRCDHKDIETIGEHDCRVGEHPHNQDIGVRCFGSLQTEVRMVAVIRGMDSEGRRYKQGVVQFRNSDHNSGRWGYFCKKKTVGSTHSLNTIRKIEADVICKAMGHKSGERKTFDDDYNYGDPNSGDFEWSDISFTLADLRCTAEVRSVDECTITWNDGYCNQGQMGVRCYV